ncbi:STAS domain-containing protein [Pseudokineococcus basanitobsidens]|uniref:STAS domain-containing protein n=1 Tax=Pseudokineococcus basanitobsidens TaxID=1926649 RepID=A0ABU8RFQ0_9ACTN
MTPSDDLGPAAADGVVGDGAPGDGVAGEGAAVALDDDDPTLLRMRGEVDLHAVETAGAGLEEALRRVEVVEAEEVTFIDSMGLHCLITAAVAARARGEKVRLVRPSRPVVQMLDITAMTDFFDVEA